MVRFEPEELDADKNKTAFFADGGTFGPQNVVGSGQMVYWLQCTIIVYQTGEERRGPIQKLATCDGQALLRRGISLTFEEGWVKQE
jgi:hypothetical protein